MKLYVLRIPLGILATLAELLPQDTQPSPERYPPRGYHQFMCLLARLPLLIFEPNVSQYNHIFKITRARKFAHIRTSTHTRTLLTTQTCPSTPIHMHSPPNTHNPLDTSWGRFSKEQLAHTDDGERGLTHMQHCANLRGEGGDHGAKGRV